MTKIILRLFLIPFLFTFLYSQEKVTLQLKWLHQFQFAGYYAAKEKGFYKEVDLDVEIKQRDLKYNNVEEVIKGKAQYGIADSILILYKARNEPVVIVSPIFQHSPSALLSLKDSGVSSPYDLDGKDVLFYPNDTDGFSLLAMMKKLNVKPNLIRKREKDDYLKLINKEVDVSPGYLSNEPFYFKEKNIDINIIDPSNYGFDFYGDILFTNKDEAKNHPKRVQKFKEATLKGWNYALENQEEIIQLIHKKYNSTKSIEHLRYEAKAIEKLILKDIIPLGSIDKGRIKYISNIYSEYGSNIKSFNVNDFIFEEYIESKTKVNLTQEEKKYLEDNPILRVQSLTAFPPYNFYENNQAQGYTIDYMNLMAKTLGVKVEFITQKTWKEFLNMLKNKQLDIIPHIAINKERREFIDFTNFEHITYNTSLTVRKGSGIKTFADLKDKTISVLNKSFLHTILKNKYPNQKLYLASTTKENVEAVASGKADAVIGNLATTEYYINHNWLSNLESIQLNDVKFIPNETPLYMGVSKGNEILKSILEKAYIALPHNKVIDLKEKWLNLKPSSKVKFTDNQYAYLKMKKKLKMCIDPNWLPFEKIEKGKHIGMTAEYIKLFQEELPIPIELVKSKDWLDTIKLAENRTCDFVTIMMDTNKRRVYFNFTENLMNMPLVISTKTDKPFINDISSVLSKRLAITKGFAYLELLKKKYPSIKIVEVKDTAAGLEKVNKGEVYGFIGVLPVIGYNIQENFATNLKIAGKLDTTVGFPMATRNDEPVLNEIINKLISNITLEKNKEILNKWLSIKYVESVDFKSILYVIGIFSIILLIIIIKNRAINRLNEKLSNYFEVVDEHVLTSTTDLDGNIVSVSQAFSDISGYSKEELIGNNHRIIKHEDMPDELFVDLWATISSGKTWKGEIKNKNKNGSYYWVDAVISPIFDDKKKIVGYTAIRHDISDKKKIEEISITDELTKLYNKRYFNQIFEQEVKRAKRENTIFALIILDVDFFKQYNDSYGHQKGDKVLESIGKELKSICQRATDIPFRIGGEEFGIIFLPHTFEEAESFAQLVNQRIENLKIEHKHNKASDYITVSIGLYVSRGDKIDTTTEIYHLSDTALYKAKSNGRNQFVVHKLDN